MPPFNYLRTCYDRAKLVLLAPAACWRTFAVELDSIQRLTTHFLVPLSGLIVCSSWIRTVLFDVDEASSLARSVVFPLSFFIIAPGTVVILARLMVLMCEKLNVKTNLGRTTTLLAYSSTPAIIGAALSTLLASKGPFQASIFYSLLLVFLGASPMLGVAGQDRTILTVGCALTGILMTLGLRLLLDPLMS